MNDSQHHNCEHLEAMVDASFDTDGLAAAERHELDTHLEACASCRESFELSSRMEQALVSKRAEVPSLDAFLPKVAPARATTGAWHSPHPRLVAALRAVMSPPGIAAILVMWVSMLALRYHDSLKDAVAWMSADRFEMLTRDVTNLLLFVSGGDAYMLTAIYVALTLVLLGSTGAITLKYIRNS